MSDTIEIPIGDLVVFDMDDTLFLERDYVRSGFNAVGQLVDGRCGTVGFGATLWTGFEQGVRGDAFDRAFEAHGLVGHRSGVPEVMELIEVYRAHKPDIRLLPDALRLLDSLAMRPMGLITDGPAESQWAKIRALGLDSRLSNIVVTSDGGPEWTKPSSLAFEALEDAVGVDPTRCWYLGDNPTKDFVTPIARGWHSVRVRRPNSLHEQVATPAGVVEVVSLDCLAPLTNQGGPS